MLYFKTIIILLLLSVTCKSQTIDFNSIYRGGIDSLRSHLTNELFRKNIHPSQDYILFYSIIIDSNDAIKAKEILRTSDKISAAVTDILLTKNQNWNFNTATKHTFILPVFLIQDKESPLERCHYTITSKDFYSTNILTEGYMLPPLVINYYRQF